jgi:hypothetical protein
MVEGPEAVGGKGASATHDGFVVECDLDSIGGENGGAAGVAKLANGDERCVAKGGEDVGDSGCGGKIGKEKIDGVGGLHGAGVWKGDDQRGTGGTFVGESGFGREEMAGAACVCDEWRGGT